MVYGGFGNTVSDQSSIQGRRFFHPTDEDLSVGTPVLGSRRLGCHLCGYAISETALERGHADPAGADEGVTLEYAHLLGFQDRMNMGSETDIEFFNGSHMIHGVGKSQLLEDHLQWREQL